MQVAAQIPGPGDSAGQRGMAEITPLASDLEPHSAQLLVNGKVNGTSRWDEQVPKVLQPAKAKVDKICYFDAICCSKIVEIGIERH